MNKGPFSGHGNFEQELYLFDSTVKMTPSATNTGVSMDGTGRLYLDNDHIVNLKLKGQLNETRFDLGVDSEYRSRSTPVPQTIKWKSTINKLSPSSDALQIDAHLNVEFSELPNYNLDTTWKYQVLILLLVPLHGQQEKFYPC